MTICDATISPVTRPKICVEPSQMIFPVMTIPGPRVETESVEVLGAAVSLGRTSPVPVVFSRPVLAGVK
jgi:hypothetical protein